jgi:hypothetical protein
MALVARSELIATLGIGTLYPDAVLDQIIAATDDVILAYLQQNRALIDQACCTETVTPPATGTRVRFRTVAPHGFRVGQAITIGLFPKPAWSNRALTVVEVQSDTVVVAESAVQWNPGVTDPAPVIPNAFVYDTVSKDFYDAVPEVREAALAIAVDMFQSRVAPGGQTEAIDFTPGPYRMGRSLLTRVSGLLGRWVDTGSLVG